MKKYTDLELREAGWDILNNEIIINIPKSIPQHELNNYTEQKKDYILREENSMSRSYIKNYIIKIRP